MAQIEVYHALPDDFDTGHERATLKGQEAHHLIRVRRTRPGEEIVVIDGHGTAWTAKVLSTGVDSAEVELEEMLENWHEPPVRVSLGLGVLKGNQFDTAVNLAVQAGVNDITPLDTRYTVAKWAAYRHERCARISLTAAKQCGRGLIPALHEAQPLNSWCIQQSAKTVKLLLDPDGEKFPKLKPGTTIALAVGPEGGFSTEEVETMKAHDFVLVRLGARRLRAETAAAVAVTQCILPLE